MPELLLKGGLLGLNVVDDDSPTVDVTLLGVETFFEADECNFRRPRAAPSWRDFSKSFLDRIKLRSNKRNGGIEGSSSSTNILGDSVSLKRSRIAAGSEVDVLEVLSVK